MIKLITGATGSGKTFFAINEAKKLGRFIYLAPCRQLVYEVFQDYANFEKDSLSTGEVKHGKHGDLYAVYESIPPQIADYRTLIIDESHFLSDEERGVNLYHAIRRAKCKGLDIMLLTATPTVDFDYLSKKLKIEIKKIELKPSKIIEKRIVEREIFFQRLKEKNPSLIFVKYAADAERQARFYEEKYKIKAGYIIADTPASERLLVQNKFKNGELDLVVASNVLAQGLNFPASNLLIEYNQWDSHELIQQKIGRIGRPRHCQSDYATYCLQYLPSIEENKKINIKNKRKTKTKLYWTTNLIEVDVDFPAQSGNSKKDWKYAIPILRKFFKFAKEEIKEEIFNFLNFVKEEEAKLLEIIKNYKK